jgi:Tfp pilus assembly ATPase PilU
MARIDTYLGNLERHRARGLVLASGQPIQLDLGDDQRKLLRKSCSEDEILTLVHELMDAEQRRQFVVEAQVRFAYRSPQVGPVTVEVERRGDQVRCEVTRARGTRESVEHG